VQAKLFRVNDCMDLWAASALDAARHFAKWQKGHLWVSGDLEVTVKHSTNSAPRLLTQSNFTFKYEDI